MAHGHGGHGHGGHGGHGHGGHGHGGHGKGHGHGGHGHGGHGHGGHGHHGWAFYSLSVGVSKWHFNFSVKIPLSVNVSLKLTAVVLDENQCFTSLGFILSDRRDENVTKGIEGST